jgi:hypothetical protein
MACEDVAEFLGHRNWTRIVKAIAVISEQEDGSTTFALLLLRGDHELNEVKAGKIAALALPLCHRRRSRTNTWAASPAISGRLRSIGKKVAFSPTAPLPR